MLKRIRSDKLCLIIILLLAAFVRFGGLTWCFPYTPHPDEWNMAAAITRLNWQEKLNPHFFAYGQFPLYLAFFSAKAYNLIPWIKIKTINTQEAIFFLRFWSAVAGAGTVYLAYLISRCLLLPNNPNHPNKPNLALIAPLLTALTPGLIQISHFGTTESLLSFFFLLILYLCFLILEKEKTKYYIFLGTVLGIALGTKISSLIFGLPVFLVLIIKLSEVFKNKNKLKNLGKLFLKNLVLLILLVLLTLLTSPYLVIAFKESRGTLLYETSVAIGQAPVFYTRQFANTTPILFQLERIFPYTLGWPIFILGISGILLSIVELIKDKKNCSKHFTFYLPFRRAGILHFTFWAYFFSQAFLFCKWTRFMAPIFAFFPIFATFSLAYLAKKIKFSLVHYSLFIILAITPGLFFSSIYFRPDIRFRASDWIYQNIPSGSQILFDTGNVLDIPVPPSNLPASTSPWRGEPNRPNLPNYSLVSFDFYHLDENPELFPQLLTHLESSDYIFIPSRRIFANHLRLPSKYPKTAKYYQLLFSEKLGFREIKEFNPFPSIQYSVFSIQLPDEAAEETWSVFDHPVIRIYKKTVRLTQNDYENLFK